MAVQYFKVIERLDEIMQDLVNRQESYEHAAEERIRYDKQVAKRLASIRLTLKFPEGGAKDTVQARADKAITALAAADDELYAKWVEAEAMYASSKAAIDVLDKAATIGMSLLKALQREGESSDPRKQPEWSRNGGSES